MKWFLRNRRHQFEMQIPLNFEQKEITYQKESNRNETLVHGYRHRHTYCLYILGNMKGTENEWTISNKMDK